ncbi:hypothetical protein [Phenylobacterium sp.]|uniref:hypothetical protein n=1 Tax=Phenylobacterium sp. TaxID=1871053 RepID=UPI0030F47BE4
MAFGKDVGGHAIAGRERLAWFGSDEDFSTGTQWDIKHDARRGMILVDATGRSWEVVGVRNLGIVGSFLGRIVRFVFQQSNYALEHELAERPPMSLEVAKVRICASIKANPDAWRDDEAIAGENGEPQEESKLLTRMLARVHRVKTFRGLRGAVES